MKIYKLMTSQSKGVHLTFFLLLCGTGTIVPHYHSGQNADAFFATTEPEQDWL